MVRRKFGVVITIIVFSSKAGAFNFPVTDSEWIQWPAYCQARYIGTAIGSRSKYAGLPVGSFRNYKKWKRMLGSTFGHIHHYCAGVIRIRRAELKESSKRKSVYRIAVSDIIYTYKNSGPDFPLFSQMSAHLAKAYVGAGNSEKARGILNRAIALQPNKSPAYIQLASILAKEGEQDKAIQILLNALERVAGQTRSIHAKLARIYMDSNNYTEAKKHTDLAYEKGYRLPGLRKKLNKMKFRAPERTAEIK